MTHIENILIRPMITEKATMQAEKFNRFGFEVCLKSNKNQIRSAIETLYDVKVVDIATSVRPGKIRRKGKHVGKTGKTKRAFVQLEVGQKIEFFKGV